MCCLFCFTLFFFKQKTAYEMRISDRSSDVCSSDLAVRAEISVVRAPRLRCRLRNHRAGHGRPVRALGLSLCAQGGRAAGLSQLDGHPKSQCGDGLLHAKCLETEAPGTRRQLPALSIRPWRARKSTDGTPVTTD